MSEYWIREDGDVDFADGEIGYINHEGIVIDSVQRDIVEACEQEFDVTRKSWGSRSFSDDEYVHWDEFKAALAEAYAKHLSRQNPAKKKLYKQLLRNDPDRLTVAAAAKAGVKRAAWDTAEGVGDARDYAMQYWGWKTYRRGSIDTWRFTTNDLQAIVRGIESIADQEGWSDRKLNKTWFTITVFSNRKHFSLSYQQMLNPRPAASMQQQDPTPDYLARSASLYRRELDYDNLHPFYKGRSGAYRGGGVVNPLGDSTLHTFRSFLDEEVINREHGEPAVVPHGERPVHF
jgi:hypothetical protein